MSHRPHQENHPIHRPNTAAVEIFLSYPSLPFEYAEQLVLRPRSPHSAYLALSLLDCQFFSEVRPIRLNRILNFRLWKFRNCLFKRSMFIFKYKKRAPGVQRHLPTLTR